jgi:hypothetical protein
MKISHLLTEVLHLGLYDFKDGTAARHCSLLM